MIGLEETCVSTFGDDRQEENSLREIIDNKNESYYSDYEGNSQTSFKAFRIKEEDGYYIYETKSGDDSYIRYKAGEETTKNLEENYKGGLFTEENFQNIQYSNEGEEELDGTETVKIKITAKLLRKEAEKRTRETMIAEFGWSEESVAAVDGFSELLDQYIKAEDEAMTPDYEGCFWIDVRTHMPVQSQVKWVYRNMGSELQKEFNSKIWEVSWIQSDMDQGISLEQSKAAIEAERASMEAQLEADMGIFDDSQIQKEYEVAVHYLYGEDCPEMEELPAEYEEMTEEGYYEYLGSLNG